MHRLSYYSHRRELGVRVAAGGAALRGALQEPAAVCYVARKPGSEPAEYAVGCDYPVVKMTGPEALADQGFTEIELGPATWDDCAAFMREEEQPFWTE